ncbi:PilZ domain-containing protein [Fundidesulfovibrio terrae]|uniref:PilZ domain-containing protein n=1 Tax=Fundidesulfovibrio terrae TaxID=2922866 RepID=UPI001FAEB514|nr:PilZ domain-containing protein [Fundidesulfovibrio terrae]
MGEEQRTFLRIPTKLHGRMRFVASESELQLFREAPITSSTVTVMELKNAGINEALVHALQDIDRKLDMLIGIHTQDSIQDDFPYPMEVVEISGAGVKVSSASPLAVDQLVEMVFTLTQLPVRMAGAIGRVIREEVQDGRQIWAIDFTKIRDRDLETIVQFVFQTQRDELRVKKWE